LLDGTLAVIAFSSLRARRSNVSPVQLPLLCHKLVGTLQTTQKRPLLFSSHVAQELLIA
jgi:hypothetical protein